MRLNFSTVDSFVGSASPDNTPLLAVICLSIGLVGSVGLFSAEANSPNPSLLAVSGANTANLGSLVNTFAITLSCNCLSLFALSLRAASFNAPNASASTPSGVDTELGFRYKSGNTLAAVSYCFATSCLPRLPRRPPKNDWPKLTAALSVGDHVLVLNLVFNIGFAI